ncbi:DUF4013 domain-containing protein [Methanobrevibacter sp. OttesenSCG-928-K11]|nr:DUF4013 domain-containing protein [Methanobrevibacter sp. OttesenSCG-928-K11]
MNLADIFKDSFIYPSSNWDKLSILGVLVLIANILVFIPTIGIDLHSIGITGILLTIVSIIILIINIIIFGYSFSIIKETINNIDSLPGFSFVTDFVNGLKVLVVSIIYYIIPVVLTLVIAYFTGVFDNVMKIITTFNGTSISETLLTNLLVSSSITMIIAIILMIIFTLLLTIAIARMADKDSFGEAFAFGEVFNTIGSIGWGNYIVWYIILIIIITIAVFISGLVNLIPIIGILISLIFIYPYMVIFSSRATGLLYNEKD